MSHYLFFNYKEKGLQSSADYPELQESAEQTESWSWTITLTDGSRTQVSVPYPKVSVTTIKPGVEEEANSK